MFEAIRKLKINKKKKSVKANLGSFFYIQIEAGIFILAIKFVVLIFN